MVLKRGIRNFHLGEKKKSDQKLNISFLIFHFGPERRGAGGAEIFVLIPVRQDEEESFAYGNSPPATGAEEFAGLKLIVIGLGAGF